MKQYELTVAIHPDLEMNMQPALDKVVDLIKSVGGEITREENEGKKRLAYKIGVQEFGLYYCYYVDLPTDAPAKISRSLAIMDEVIRYLLVTKDERREKMEAKRKAASEENEETEDKTEAPEESNTNEEEK